MSSIPGSFLTFAGPEARVKRETHIPYVKYLEVTYQANRLLNKICSIRYSWQIYLYNYKIERYVQSLAFM